ncbi:contactin-associated protein 1-like [Hemitrygon akajei]|uniref:contactin-associated protein 1-like n=1 Tax=Hemitrygon akajei TaxID=2704970 RepID=UPI003BF9489B
MSDWSEPGCGDRVRMFYTGRKRGTASRRDLDAELCLRETESDRGRRPGPGDPALQHAGFTGCLAGVSFNGIVPLKAALRTDTNQSVVVQGDLVESNCGAIPIILSDVLVADDPWALQPDTPFFESDSLTGAVIGVIVALILFAIVALAVLLFLYNHRHKGSYHTNEAKPPSGVKTTSLKKNLPQIVEEAKGE